MVKHNNVIPNAHFRKEWQERVKTWLDQPLRKARRRAARAKKAAAIAPRPVAGALRPAVRCQTVRYNIRVRAGRGFTLEELKAAGVTARQAATIGIAVDHRRRNKSTASLQENVARLRTYLDKVVLPRKNRKDKKVSEEWKNTAQLTGEVLPIRQPAAKVEFVAVTDALKSSRAYATLRQARADSHMVGKRAKKAKEAAEAKPAATAAEE